MLQQLTLKGPAKPPETTIDRTMTLDPAELWPDPLECPDWPNLDEASLRRTSFIRGRKTAEAQLETLARHFNRGHGQLRAPTEAERADLFARLFTRGPTRNSRWLALGITDLNPRGPMVEGEVDSIVEAAHLRAYLRKLDAQEAKEAEEKVQRERERAQRTVDGYVAAQAAGKAELEGLADAVARHEQRLADEQAYRRAGEVRHSLSHGHFEAVQAARELGIAPPAAPELRG
jgi:hypothetical protein